MYRPIFTTNQALNHSTAVGTHYLGELFTGFVKISRVTLVGSLWTRLARYAPVHPYRYTVYTVPLDRRAVCLGRGGERGAPRGSCVHGSEQTFPGQTFRRPSIVTSRLVCDFRLRVRTRRCHVAIYDRAAAHYCNYCN